MLLTPQPWLHCRIRGWIFSYARGRRWSRGALRSTGICPGSRTRKFHSDVGGRLRVRPNILRCARVPYNSAQHEPDHCEKNATNGAPGEVLVLLRAESEPPAAAP